MNKEYIDLKRRTVYRGDIYQAIENERIKVLSDVLISPYDNGVHDGLKKALVALANNVNDIPTVDVVDAGYKAFAEWVARIIFNGGLEDESFCELACRKLNDLGIVEKTENEWHFDDPVKSITPAYLVETQHGAPTINAVPVVFCRECRHRDPEDRKCDCGQIERQGCPFPVDDDYFCKYGARREWGDDDDDN